MKNVIPVEIAELALETKQREIDELKQEISKIKNAGKTLSLKIHKSNTFAEFYPNLGEFEELINRK